MKASEFRKFYLTFVNLYGVIDSDESYKIIKKWYPDLKKADYLKDLKDRHSKMTREYVVRKTDKRNHYIIQGEIMDDEIISYIFREMRGKEYFVTDDLDSYLDIGKTGIDLEDSAYDMIDSFVKKGFDRNHAEILVHLLYERLRLSIDPMEPIKSIIENIEFDSVEDAQEFLDSFVSFQKDVRMFTNGGFTPAEMAAKQGPIDPDKVGIDLGPNIRKQILNSSDIEIAEMIAEIEDSELPSNAKKSMIEQIRNIIQERNKAKMMS